MSAIKHFTWGTRKAIEIFILIGAAGAMTAAALDALAQQKAVRTPDAAIAREVIPGAESMTSAEREAYRQRMEAAATPEEKARVRAEHVKTLQAPIKVGTLVGDPVRGASLHKGCFGCHGIERYVAPITYTSATFIDSLLRASGLSDMPPVEPTRFKGRIKSLAALREGVTRRNDFLNPKMTPQEIEDVVAYLNATYYNFTQP